MYLGEINHRGESFPADHAPIVGNDLFEAVQSVLSENLNRRDLRKGRSEALLLGLLFDDRGNRMSPSHAVKKGVRYRYYVSSPVAQGRKEDAGSVHRVSASGIEQAVREALRARANISAEATASSNRERKASELSDEDLLRRVRRIELRADRILITRLSDGVGGQDGKEEQPEDPDLESPACATFELAWRAPSSHPKRHIILPADAELNSEVKPLRNEERLKVLRAIVTARKLRDSVLPLPEDSIDAIASRHGKTERWVRKHLTLAFLDPKFVEAAVDGVLPRGYGLSRFFDLPADWNEQWRVLGLRNPRSDDLAGRPREH
jgi:hypothetical protein